MTPGDDVTFWMALHALPGMGPITFRRLLDRFGGARAVFEDSTPESLGEIPGMKADLIAALRKPDAVLEWAKRMADRLQQRGVRIMRRTDDDYPPSLEDLHAPPPLLYVFGEIRPGDARSVSIVGTTKPSPRGRPIAEEFAGRLGAEGVTVVSGFAHGIDAAAHRGAFRGGGRSILCLPYGIRRFRPRGDFPPLPELAQRGAIVSECPPEAPWTARAAVSRDRIIAALGRVLFVIETRPRGGTMHTVAAAETLGRPIFALKYQAVPATARGNTLLLARGASPIARFHEVRALLDAVDAAS